MRCAIRWPTLVLLVLATHAGFAADPPARRTPREALKPFNVLIGSWQALGKPEGNQEQQRKGAWQETISWEWQFKDGDAWLKASFDRGKYFAEGTLRYLPASDQFQLALTTVEKQTVVFTGPLKGRKLLLERQDEKTKATQRLVVSLLYDNRFLYQYEVQPENRTLANKIYLVGATKEGRPLVAESDEVGPLCVVSYGPPISEVMYRGKIYYIC